MKNLVKEMYELKIYLFDLLPKTVNNNSNIREISKHDVHANYVILFHHNNII